MKLRVLRSTAFILILVLILSSCVFATGSWENPYSDVTPELWSYSSIRALQMENVLPVLPQLQPYVNESRENFVSYLYALHLALGGKAEKGNAVPFTDVTEENPNCTAILWAKNNGIVSGIDESRFAPSDSLTRAQVCAIIMRYANFAKLSLEQVQEPIQFRDSHRIDDYAKSAVVACQMTKIVNGYPDGRFAPNGTITREQCIAMLARLLRAAKNPAKQSVAISTEPGAYDDVYDGFEPPFSSLVPLNDAVALSYFDKVAFIGDSVSVMLQYYCAATSALGNATFLCSGSLSATNALWPVSGASVHPFYQGKKMLLEDSVAQSGAKIIYIMLGINNLSAGIDKTTEDMLTLIGQILEKSPDVSIVIESVTPMARSSSIMGEKLNNEIIRQYNEKMLEICEDRGWYFVNVAECVTDAEGYLITEYCSDNSGMGIHFTYPGAEAWVAYLKTHVPAALQ